MPPRAPIARGLRASLIRLAVLASTLLLSTVAQAQGIDNKGTEFLFAYLPNLCCPSIEVQLTADTATQVTVQYPSEAPTFNQTVAVQPGQITIVTLPPEAASGWVHNTVSNNLVRATAEAEFVAYLVNRRSATTDAALGLPIDALNTDYVVAGKAHTGVAPFRWTV